MLESKAFGETFLSALSNFLHLYIMKACWWNLISFSRFANAFIRKEKKSSYSSQLEKKNLFYLTSYFMKTLKMAINHFSSIGLIVHKIFLFCKLLQSAIFAFWCQDDARNAKKGSWEEQITTNSKLQYLFQK